MNEHQDGLVDGSRFPAQCIFAHFDRGHDEDEREQDDQAALFDRRGPCRPLVARIRAEHEVKPGDDEHQFREVFDQFKDHARLPY